MQLKFMSLKIPSISHVVYISITHAYVIFATCVKINLNVVATQHYQEESTLPGRKKLKKKKKGGREESTTRKKQVKKQKRRRRYATRGRSRVSQNKNKQKKARIKLTLTPLWLGCTSALQI